ncbi:MAG TPA: protein-glutamate O-methyltransferase CheR [Nitriliruptorales bacterium]|nr:protein-glutamate O-methyltransferase CheR [Nitriliruptorales bacterium]
MTGAQTDDVTPLARYLEARTGLSVDGPRQTARLRRAVARSGQNDSAAYVALLRRDDAAFDQLVAEVTVTESYFFREPGHFAALRTTIVPDLIADRPAHHVLRFWSAGCAGGEEPYTLAIVLDQAGWADRSRILATDLSTSALDRARRAVYADWSLRSLEHRQRRLWFRPVVGGHRLDERYARRVTFRRSGLLDESPVDGDVARAGFDVILCRNVLVHLTSDAVRQVAARLAAALAPWGRLITGAGDPPLLPVAGVEPATTPNGVVYRRVGGRAATAAPEPPSRRRGGRAPDAHAAWDQHDQPDESTSLDASRHLLRATLLLETGRPHQAAEAARAAAYLRPDLSAAHLTLGVALVGAGNLRAAHRAFRTAGAQLAAAPPHQVVPFSGGERAGRLLQLATDHERRTAVGELVE